MPLQVSSNLTATGTTTPVVSTDLVIHLPEEIVSLATRTERENGRLLVCCRSFDQAARLADRLLDAAVGSAVVSADLSRSALTATLDAFRYGDFTVLLISDDAGQPFRVDPEVHLVHADLPSPRGGIQLMSALNHRRERIADPARVA